MKTKCLISILITLLLIPIATALIDCKGIMDPNDIPCLIVSSWQFPNCNNTLMTIYNSTQTLKDTRNYTDFGLSGKCNVTWNYSEPDSYFWNDTVGDSGHIIVEYGDDTMASLAIMLFMMTLTGVIFWIGLKKKFTDSEIPNFLIKRCFYLVGLGLLMFDIVIAVNIASNSGLLIEQILFRILWAAGWIMFLSVLALFWSSVTGYMEMWKMKKMKKRMGYE